MHAGSRHFKTGIWPDNSRKEDIFCGFVSPNAAIPNEKR
jgi:hypothetical protein